MIFGRGAQSFQSLNLRQETRDLFVGVTFDALARKLGQTDDFNLLEDFEAFVARN